MSEHFDVIVVGGGPAGLTAGIYARRAGKSVLVLERESFGGQIALAPLVENYPGIPSIPGAELSARLYAQAEALGARLELEAAEEIRPGPPHTVRTDYGSYTCTALVLATGMRRRTLGLPGEEKWASFCAVCDGAFYAGRDVAVCGGGGAALQDALFLSSLCRRVTLIHRRETFRGDPVLVERLRARDNVSLCLNTVITALHGGETLTGLTLRNTATGAQLDLPADALFEAVGQQPETALTRALGLQEKGGFVFAGESCAASLPGIFAAGDCRTKEVRQLTTACSDGAVAALAACGYVDRVAHS